MLPDPRLHIILKANEFKIHLVENRLDTIGFILNRGNLAFHYIISTDLPPRALLRILPGMDSLITTLFSYLISLAFSGHKGNSLAIGHFPFQISDEGVDIDMLMASIPDGAHNNNRLPAFITGKILQPGTRQHLCHHFFSNSLGVRIIPPSAQIDDHAGIHSGHALFRTTAPQGPKKSGIGTTLE